MVDINELSEYDMIYICFSLDRNDDSPRLGVARRRKNILITSDQLERKAPTTDWKMIIVLLVFILFIIAYGITIVFYARLKAQYNSLNSKTNELADLTEKLQANYSNLYDQLIVLNNSLNHDIICEKEVMAIHHITM